MDPGSHVGFPISAKNKNLVYDHPMNKPLSQLNCDFAGMIIGWSCTKVVNRLPIGAKFGSNLLVVSEKKMKM
jgi:hypothetical protein